VAGHSKWANIKHRKAKVDAQKGAAFAKYSREIIISAKEGGVDPAGNFKLRTAIEKAKAAGLPNDNIKRAIEKASGGGDDSALEAINYEGYGPGGVAVLIEALTDNRNRTAGDIRSYFNKYNGNLGETGCVSWMFKEEGLISINRDGLNQDEFFEIVINIGAKDFLADDQEVFKIVTSPESLQSICEEIEKAGYIVESAELAKSPQNIINIEDEDIAKNLLRLLDCIENHDDVRNVYANFEMDDALIEKVQG
jgi:YebC/PmpR family DNA-binding regulatory protein